jgi:hypothetical protein
VGFQTTALLEAAAVGKPTFYTFWTGPVLKSEPNLIPFHYYEEVMTICRSPQQLRSNLLAPHWPLPAKNALSIAEHLGPLDGRASDRVLDLLQQVGSTSSAHKIGAEIPISLWMKLMRRAVMSAWGYCFWLITCWLSRNHSYRISVIERAEWHRQSISSLFGLLTGR